VSPNAIDLVKKLTRKDPNERITAEEALQHPWFNILKSLPAIVEGKTDNEAATPTDQSPETSPVVELV
jgi:serine/threonine protein kinase